MIVVECVSCKRARSTFLVFIKLKILFLFSLVCRPFTLAVRTLSMVCGWAVSARVFVFHVIFRYVLFI